MIMAVVETSHRDGEVRMDDEHLDVMGELREFMFERVYLRPESEAQKEKAIIVIQDLVAYYQAHPGEVPDSYTVPDADSLTRAVDYVAGMTDRFALHTHDRLFRPSCSTERVDLLLVSALATVLGVPVWPEEEEHGKTTHGGDEPPRLDDAKDLPA
jgi:dGTPase